MRRRGLGTHNGQDGPKPAPVVDAARDAELARWLRGQRVERRLHLRATIIWQVLVERQPARHVAHALGVCVKTITKWRSRHLAQGVDGLHDRPRSGAPSRFSVGQRCEVLAIACDNPANYGYPGERI